MARKYKNLSKSQYCKGKKCLKSIWLYQHKRKIADPPSEFQKNIFDQGTEVGKLATKYFHGGIEITEDYTQPEKAMQKTQEAITYNAPAIFEAAFLYNEVLIRVDVLRNNEDGSWDLIEVKSTNIVDPKVHYDDVAIQKWVLLNSGITVKNCYLMHLNREYVRQGKLDLKKLFLLENLDEVIKPNFESVANTLRLIKSNLILDNEPNKPIGSHCKSPYVCEFKSYCWKDDVTGSIHRLGRINDKKRHVLMDQGIQMIKDIPDNFDLSTNQQIECCSAKNNDVYLQLKDIQMHLEGLVYPLYYLDYESVAYAIPKYNGSWPHKHLTTQYSLHIQETSDSKLEHHEFLHNEDSDPSEALVKSLITNIKPDRGSVIVYHKTYERDRTKELADTVPEFRDRLEDIIDRMWDLELPFAKRWYWDPRFGGSSSIKKVLPVFAPELSYQDLEINKGDLAQLKYAEMIKLSKSSPERGKIQQNLLKYCQRDTLAMVRVLSQLVKIIEIKSLEIAS